MFKVDLTSTSRNFTLYPLLYLAICFAGGIVYAEYSNNDWRILLTLTIVFSAALIISINHRCSVVFLLAAFILGGASYYRINGSIKNHNAIGVLYDSGAIKSGDPIEIEGTVLGSRESTPRGFFILVKTASATYKRTKRNVSGNVRLFATVETKSDSELYDQLDIRHGKVIRTAVRLKREDRFNNPGSISHKRLLDQKQIAAIGVIKSPHLVETPDEPPQLSLIGNLYELRSNLIDQTRGMFNSSTAGIIIASLFGNRYYLSRENAAAFREGGTFHILVISGLHITFIGGFFLLLLKKFTQNALIQFATVSFVLWSYALVVGGQIPVMRAAMMFSILLFSYVIYREATSLNSLGICGFAILIWRPEDIFSPSFHLTFASLTGITAVAIPLIAKLRAIGNWKPTAANPFPPRGTRFLRPFCEALYWSERQWLKSSGENIWSCKIIKSPVAIWLEDRRIQAPLRWGFEGVLLTAIVQLSMLPFLVIYFHRISFASGILNLWVTMLIVFQNIAAIGSIILASISESLSLPLIRVTESANSVLLSLPKFIVSLEFSSTRVPVYTGVMQFIYLIYFVPVFLFIYQLTRWNPFGLAPGIAGRNQTGIINKLRGRFAISILGTTAVFALILFHPFSAPRANGNLTINFLDVGQGDSAFITFPNGRTMLVDGGGLRSFAANKGPSEPGESEFEPDTARIGEIVVSEFLWEKGYSSVDYLLASHSDTDHIGGLSDVVKNFGVGIAFVSRQSLDNDSTREFIQLLDRKRIQIRMPVRGDTFEIGGVKIEVLNPDRSSKSSSNNDSIVLLLTYGARKILLTGDIERDVEEKLLDRYSALRADIVKVAHHGSRTSSSARFVGSTGASYAIISAGKRSPFGHPHREVVERWRKAGARILETAGAGTISVSTNGKSIEVQTFEMNK